MATKTHTQEIPVSTVALIDDHGRTLADMQRQIDELNEKARAVIHDDHPADQPLLVQLAGLTQQIIGLIKSQDDLDARQQRLDAYARNCAEAAAVDAAYKQSADILRSVDALRRSIMSWQVSHEMQRSPSHTTRKALVQLGIPNDIISEVERRNRRVPDGA